MATEIDDLFDDATDKFLKTEHLKGRLVLVRCESIGERESTYKGQEGQFYKYVTSSTIVLDGKPDEMIPAVPFIADGLQWSGSAVTGFLIPKVGKRPILGRVSTKPSSTKNYRDAWVISEPTDADKAIARAWLGNHPEWANPPKPDVFDTGE